MRHRSAEMGWGQEGTCPASRIPGDSLPCSVPTWGVSGQLRRGMWRRTSLPVTQHPPPRPSPPEAHVGGGTLRVAWTWTGSSATRLSFYRSNPAPSSRLPAPGVRLHAWSWGGSGKGAAAALRAASPSPPFDNGLNRALLPKAKFVICHFSDGRFSFGLLTEPREDAGPLPRHAAGAGSGGRGGARGSEPPFSSHCQGNGPGAPGVSLPPGPAGDCGCH